ncbi:MAG: cellulose biosynthesis cyclic di-GMP-binding regulatory protein BcsB [Legionellales bacterium]
MYIKDFNEIKLGFIGRCRAICDNPANTSLWLDVSKSSYLELSVEPLQLKNDLSHFPEPFFDTIDDKRLVLPMVFAGQPSLSQQRSAAVLASWFGHKAQWRGQSFPVLFNQLPNRHAVLFVTNSQRPDFLKNYPLVQAATIEMVDHPTDPHIKLLVISGRDDADLNTAVEGIAFGNVLFRGERITVNKVDNISKRRPYDAPNWVRTDRPTQFSELQKYKGQFQTLGFNPRSIQLSFNLPPDLFLSRTGGINVKLKYRYTPPPASSNSFLSIHLNHYFIQSITLDKTTKSSFLGLDLTKGLTNSEKQLIIQAPRLDPDNEMAFNFDYTNVVSGGIVKGQCETYTLINNYAAIDGTSTIDFSHYHHFIAMPNLSAYAKGGFPFSRMADLSETWVLVKAKPEPIQVTTLLNAIGSIGAQTGFPAVGLTLKEDWSKAQDQDKDLLIIGNIPPELTDDSKINMLIDKTQSWVKSPRRKHLMPSTDPLPSDMAVQSKTGVNSNKAMAAIIGVQSPQFKERSIIALLADSPQGFELLNKTLTSNKKISEIYGSVAVIRDSGVSSLQVGPVYYVGHLPWWSRIWFALQKHPVNLAITALISAILLTYVLWRVMRAISRRRLKHRDEA